MLGLALTKKQKQLLTSLRSAAREQMVFEIPSESGQSDVGRTFSGLIGELSACELLPELRWMSRKGYDALSKGRRYQIKTRRPGRPDARFTSSDVGRFKNDGYDYGLFVELEYDFSVHQIYRLPRKKIHDLQDARSSKRMRGIRLCTFREHGEPLIPKRKS